MTTKFIYNANIAFIDNEIDFTDRELFEVKKHFDKLECDIENRYVVLSDKQEDSLKDSLKKNLHSVNCFYKGMWEYKLRQCRGINIIIIDI